MSYPDSVRYLYALGNEMKTAKLGLERMGIVLQALGHPERACRFVHVAGTNGKGSTCAMIEAGLRAAGVTTGLFTSPHLIEPTERIRINGVDVSAGQFAGAFDTVHAAAEELLAADAIDTHPSYFETVTAMAFVLFRDAAVDTVVLEVGLGGRLDATNVVTPAICVITPIDYDHEALLGSTIAKIASEKAGILKAGVSAVFTRQRPEADRVLTDVAADLGCPVRRTSDWPVSDLALAPEGCSFEAGGHRLVCPLAGEHQVENALAAAIALDSLGVPPDGIANAKWPGRLERIAPGIYLDGAHNPAGAQALAAYIERFYSGKRIVLVYGAMRDKALEEVTGTLFPLAAEIVLTAPQSARAVDPQRLADAHSASPVRVAPGLRAAIHLAKDLNPDVVFITGSLFVVGEARAILLESATGLVQ
ncbi:MAG: folylpolyglutamate synthase/dihydrofolate synthase family protein [Bryobacteraceae bacterium]